MPFLFVYNKILSEESQLSFGQDLLKTGKNKNKKKQIRNPDSPRRGSVLIQWPLALGLLWSQTPDWHCRVCPILWNPGSWTLWYLTICHLAWQGAPQTTKTLGLLGMTNSSQSTVYNLGPRSNKQVTLHSWLENWQVKSFTRRIW